MFFLLRPWKSSDYPNLSLLAKNPQVMRFVNQEKPWSGKRIRSFIHKQEKLFWKEGYCHWVIEDKLKRNFVGLCGVGVVWYSRFFRDRLVDCKKILVTRLCNRSRTLCFGTLFQENQDSSLKISRESGRQGFHCRNAQDRFSTKNEWFSRWLPTIS